MMDFAVNAKSNDIEITNGDIALCDSFIATISQTIVIRLKTLAGEWFMDQNIGVPYLTQVLGKKPNDRFLRKVISKEMQTIADIKKLSDFSFQQDSISRSMTIKFKAILQDQTTIHINQVIGI